MGGGRAKATSKCEEVQLDNGRKGRGWVVVDLHLLCSESGRFAELRFTKIMACRCKVRKLHNLHCLCEVPLSRSSLTAIASRPRFPILATFRYLAALLKFNSRGCRVPGFPNTCCRVLLRVALPARRVDGALSDPFRVSWACDHNTGAARNVEGGRCR